MAYKENLNYKTHDLNTSTVTINGSHNIQSLHSIKMEYTDPRTTVVMADDGTGIKVKNNKRNGLVTLEILQGSPSNKVLWDLLYEDSDDGITIDHVDSNQPDLKSSAPHASIAGTPMEGRSGAHEVITWTFEEVYLDIRGASQAQLG